MSIDLVSTSARPLRADARRNREAILQAARALFAREGVLASLDRIAMDAKVGNATLYRNFPTREDLLAALMEADVADAQTQGRRLQRDCSPRHALAEWLVWLTWRLRIWRDLPDCIAKARTTSDTSMTPAVSVLMVQTAVIVEQASAAGDMVGSVSASEVFELITALSWAVDRFGDDEAAARRRVEIATAGLFT